MYKFCVLYSGSTGNATYIGTKKEGILIDAGKNAKQLCLALSNCGIKPEAVKAVFLTHEHIDHIGAIRVFCNRFNIPVYASLNTLEVLDFNGHLNGDFDVFQMQGLADIGDFHIESFHTMHDVTESFGFNVFLPNGIKTSVITDLGVVTEEVEEAILESKVILLESNHDESMLLTGPYPYSLKRRIICSVPLFISFTAISAAASFERCPRSDIIRRFKLYG